MILILKMAKLKSEVMQIKVLLHQDGVKMGLIFLQMRVLLTRCHLTMKTIIKTLRNQQEYPH